MVVRFNRETGLLDPDQNFRARLKAWNIGQYAAADPYRLSEMPDIALLEKFVVFRDGYVAYNFLTHRLESVT